MENLVIVENGQAVTDSRKIAEVFEKRHDHVIRAIKNLVESAEDNSPQNWGQSKMFIESTYKDGSGKSNKLYFMNRDGFTLLAMGFTGAKAMEWKLKYIDAFNKMEQRLKELATPTPMEQMAQGILAAQKVLAEKDNKIKTLQSHVDELTPKGIFADAVSGSTHSILIGDLAKILKQNGVETGQKRLFERLRNDGFLMKSGTSKNMPTQRSMELGLFNIKENTVVCPDGSIKVTKTTKVTGKGQIYFINRFKKKDVPAVLEDPEKEV